MLTIKWARLQRGWSQLDLAYRSKVQPSEISRIERGQAKPYPKQAKRIASALGLPETELLQEHGEQAHE